MFKVNSLTVTVFFLLSYNVYSQNLVRNPGFENVLSPSCNLTSSPSHFSTMVADWTLATDGTADMRSMYVDPSCLTHCQSTHDKVHGRELPYEGNVMMGLYTYHLYAGGDYREYVQVELLKPLEPGKKYVAEMYVSRAENFVLSTNNIGMYFSDTKIAEPNSGVLNFTPQVVYNDVITDTAGWVKVSGEFLAQSASRFLIIGNFNDNQQTTIESLIEPGTRMRSAYYFVDMVAVYENPYEAVDTIICEGDSILFTPGSDSLISWSYTDNQDGTFSTNSQLWMAPDSSVQFYFLGLMDTILYRIEVKPAPPVVFLGDDSLIICIGDSVRLKTELANNADYLWSDGTTGDQIQLSDPGWYWLQSSNDCGSNRDSVFVQHIQCECHIFVPNIFTPNHDSLNDQFSPSIDCETTKYHLQIYNRWGERLFESYSYDHKWNGTYRNEHVPDGVYFWILIYAESVTGNNISQSLSGTVTVLR